MTKKIILTSCLVGVFVVAKGVCAESNASDAYSQLWNTEVQSQIDLRIEKHRKADGKFEVPVPDGTEVKVEQVSHAFQFGSHIFNFDQLGRDDWNDLYKATFTNLWNSATLPFYWKGMEPEEGVVRYSAGSRDCAEFWNSVCGMSAKEKSQFIEYRRPSPDPLLDFCEKNGISPHGHVMIYPPFHPPWTTNGVDAAVLGKRYERRIRQLGAHYGARIPQWDVVNAFRIRRGMQPLYGIGADDTHNYRGEPGAMLMPGNAWSLVRAESLDAVSLIEAMNKGDFVTCEGLELDDVSFDQSTGTLEVSAPPGLSVRTVRFIVTKRDFSEKPIGKVTVRPAHLKDRMDFLRDINIYDENIGKIVKTVRFRPGEPVRASYVMESDDLYVRARIEEKGATFCTAPLHPQGVRVAWTQPYGC